MGISLGYKMFENIMLLFCGGWPCPKSSSSLARPALILLLNTCVITDLD